MPWLIQVNIVFLFFFSLVFFLPLDHFFIGRILRSLVEMSFIFFLPGINLAFLLQYFLKKKWSVLEFITITLVFSLFFLPLLLTLEYTKLKILSPLLPFINALCILILTLVVGVYFFYKKKETPNIFESSLNVTTLRKTFFSPNFLSPFLLYVTVIISIVTAYYPLPDLDPYYWITQYRNQFQTQTITLLSGHRPLFSSLTYLFTSGAHIDFYAYFKYVLPAFFLLLIFPSALLAQKFSHPLHKIIIFFFPFTSGITIIFLTLPIPQAIANIGLFFFFSLLTYSFITKDSFFYFLGGTVLFLSFLYHEAMALLIAPWLIVSLWIYRRKIIDWTKKNTLTTVLFLFVILPILSTPLSFVLSHIESLIAPFLHPHPNFLFPQYYVNIDGNPMGWGDLFGVAKYYLFYIGPPLLLTLFILILSLKNKLLRSSIFSREGLVFSAIFIIFLAIAEILPRFVGVAFLPDRAWVFAGTITLFFLVTLFLLPIGKNKFFLWLLIIGFSTNIAAAVYINTLKKYTITNQQLTSAEWVNHNIPANCTLFSYENGKLLTFFTNEIQTVFIQDPNFYFDRSVFEKEFTRYKNKDIDQSYQYKTNLEVAQKNITQLSKKNIRTDREEIQLLINTTHETLNMVGTLANSTLQDKIHPSEEFYIYYSAPNPKNPYIGRPYNKQLLNKESAIIFNQDPDTFKLIYSDEKEKIYIWKIL